MGRKESNQTNKITDKSHFVELYIFMSTSLWKELLIIRNKTSSPDDFEFTRFDCSFFNDSLFLGSRKPFWDCDSNTEPGTRGCCPAGWTASSRGPAHLC